MSRHESLWHQKLTKSTGKLVLKIKTHDPKFYKIHIANTERVYCGYSDVYKIILTISSKEKKDFMQKIFKIPFKPWRTKPKRFNWWALMNYA